MANIFLISVACLFILAFIAACLAAKPPNGDMSQAVCIFIVVLLGVPTAIGLFLWVYVMYLRLE